MMAARPTTRPAQRRAETPTASTVRSVGIGVPRVRDFATPSTSFSIEWDIRTVYDFLFSLNEDHDFPHDLLDEDKTWLAEARSALAEQHADEVEMLLGSEMSILVAAYAVEHPELTTVDAFLDAFEAAPTNEMLETMLCDLVRDPEIGDLVVAASTGDSAALADLRAAIPDHKVGFQALLQDPAAGHRTLVRILRAWAGSFARIEPRIQAILERDHALRATDRGSLKPTELIEHTTGGIRWLPEVGVKRVILAPTYFSRPYNILLAGPDWRFFAYPVGDSALEAEDRLAPPQAVVRLHRALGDETRLRILKLLAAQDLYLTEIAQQLDLSKPTIKHHLALLRAAGLVTVVEAGTVIYYSLRRDRIEAASTDLARFLIP
jgi:DNA-binding transcriptional ArsR family regulator